MEECWKCGHPHDDHAGVDGCQVKDCNCAYFESRPESRELPVELL